MWNDHFGCHSWRCHATLRGVPLMLLCLQAHAVLSHLSLCRHFFFPRTSSWGTRLLSPTPRIVSILLLRLTALLGDRTQSQPYCTQISTYVKGEVLLRVRHAADFATLRDCTRFPNLPSNIVMWIITTGFIATCVVVSRNFVASWAYESHFSTS